MKATDLEKVERYLCPHCRRYFITPNRHYCHKDPAMKSCFTCANMYFDNNPPEGNRSNALCRKFDEACWVLAEEHSNLYYNDHKQEHRPSRTHSKYIYFCGGWESIYSIEDLPF